MQYLPTYVTPGPVIPVPIPGEPQYVPRNKPEDEFEPAPMGFDEKIVKRIIVPDIVIKREMVEVQAGDPTQFFKQEVRHFVEVEQETEETTTTLNTDIIESVTNQDEHITVYKDRVILKPKIRRRQVAVNIEKVNVVHEVLPRPL